MEKLEKEMFQIGSGDLNCSDILSQMQWVQERIVNAASNAAQTHSNKFNQTALNHWSEMRNSQMFHVWELFD